jgi:hypothetical protein
MLLCDFAEEVGGKLYIMGGGWSHITMNTPTADLSLAIVLRIPWDQTNRPHDIRTVLVDEDGEPIPNPEGNPLAIAGKVEVGRPPGVKPGSTFNVPLAMRFNGVPLEAGGYSFLFEVDGHELTRVTFEAIGGGGPQQ